MLFFVTLFSIVVLTAMAVLKYTAELKY